jgi:NifU-like protein involved in Fe-S cluster formation
VYPCVAPTVSAEIAVESCCHNALKLKCIAIVEFSSGQLVRAMSSDLYSNRVLELAASIARTGRLAAPDGSAHKVSRLCGSEVTVDLCLAGDVVSDFAILPRACALGQASAAVLAAHVVGATVAEVRAARDALEAMLRRGGEPPGGRFWELRYLEPVRDYLPRHASTLLAFEAAVAAIDQAEALAAGRSIHAASDVTTR